MTKKEKKIVVKDDLPRDEHYYKFEESVAMLTGVTHSCLNEQGVKVNVVYNFTIVDKHIYSVMRHRYLSFKAFNDKANATQKKPEGRFYFDNQVELAQRLGVDRKTVNKSIDKLVTIGVVEKFFQRAKNSSGMCVKSLSYKVNDLFDVQGVRCFFDISTEGSDCIERTFVVGKKEQVVVETPKQFPKKHIVGTDYDDDPECPF